MCITQRNKMNDSDQIIVSLTSWAPRFATLPIVLDSLFHQSVKPDLVVLNLAGDELVPTFLETYIEQHGIEVNRMPNTKVFKKLVPTLRKYPESCVISIDDDFILPDNMLSDFMEVHSRYPDFPISGNTVVLHGMQCHCGSASLTKATYFGDYLNAVDDDLMMHCKSDDMVYTFLCNKAGHPYIRTQQRYFLNMQAVDSSVAYSKSQRSADKSINDTIIYLTKRFGKIENKLSGYVTDPYLASISRDVEQKGQTSLKMMLKEKFF